MITTIPKSAGQYSGKFEYYVTYTKREPEHPFPAWLLPSEIGIPSQTAEVEDFVKVIRPMPLPNGFLPSEIRAMDPPGKNTSGIGTCQNQSTRHRCPRMPVFSLKRETQTMKVSRQYPKRVKLRQSENVLLGLILRRQMTLRKC